VGPIKKRAEKEDGKKKEMITVEVTSNSKRLWRSRVRRRHEIREETKASVIG
jgi:hypothetical protein